MPIKTKQTIRLLKKSGFVEVRQNGSHKFFVNESTNRRTVVPVHCRDIPKGLELEIRKQAGLSEEVSKI